MNANDINGMASGQPSFAWNGRFAMGETTKTGIAMISGSGAKLAKNPIDATDGPAFRASVPTNERWGQFGDAARAAMGYAATDHDNVKSGLYPVGPAFAVKITRVKNGFRLTPVYKNRPMLGYGKRHGLFNVIVGRLIYGPALKTAGYRLVKTANHTDVINTPAPAPDAAPAPVSDKQIRDELNIPDAAPAPDPTPAPDAAPDPDGDTA